MLAEKFRIYLLFTVTQAEKDVGAVVGDTLTGDPASVTVNATASTTPPAVQLTVRCRVVIQDVPIRSTVEKFIVPFAKRLLRQQTDAMIEYCKVHGRKLNDVSMKDKHGNDVQHGTTGTLVHESKA